MVSKRTLSVVALVALVVLAGCAGAGSGGSDGGAAGEYEQATGGDAGQPEATGAPTGEPDLQADAGGSGGDAADEGDGGSDTSDDRAIIRTGTVAVEVEDFQAARSNLTTTVQGYGGYVSDSREDRREIDNETWTRGEVVLRVPSENFDALVDDTRALGEVQSVETNSRDVSDQLVDIEARLDNLRAERDQLRALYDQANTTEDVLAVQRELSDVQQEIERLEARQQSLEDQVAYSTLTVRLAEPRPTPDRVAPDRWYDTPVVSALLESIGGVVVVARALVVGFAYALPYLVAFGIPLALVGGAVLRFGRRFRRGTGADPELDQPEEAEVDEHEDAVIDENDSDGVDESDDDGVRNGSS